MNKSLITILTLATAINLFSHSIPAKAQDSKHETCSTYYDLNKDGIKDIIKAEFNVYYGKSCYEIKAYTGAKNQTHSTPKIIAELPSRVFQVSHLEFQDMNGDGIADIVAETKYIKAYYGDTNATWILYGKKDGTYEQAKVLNENP